MVPNPFIMMTAAIPTITKQVFPDPKNLSFNFLCSEINFNETLNNQRIKITYILFPIYIIFFSKMIIIFS